MFTNIRSRRKNPEELAGRIPAHLDPAIFSGGVVNKDVVDNIVNRIRDNVTEVKVENEGFSENIEEIYNENIQEYETGQEPVKYTGDNPKLLAKNAWPKETAKNAPQDECPNNKRNQFTCSWCKKDYSTSMGRLRHSWHCNWNPDKLNSLKSRRIQKREAMIPRKHGFEGQTINQFSCARCKNSFKSSFARLQHARFCKEEPSKRTESSTVRRLNRILKQDTDVKVEVKEEHVETSEFDFFTGNDGTSGNDVKVEMLEMAEDAAVKVEPTS